MAKDLEYPSTEHGRALVEEFDERVREPWRGLEWYADRYRMTRQGVQWLLMKFRKKEYLKLRRPQGKRNDLLGRGK